MPLSGQRAWQSNGGPVRGHPARGLPFSFEARLPEVRGLLAKIHLLGIFALYSENDVESPGTLGASVQLLGSDRDILARYDLINGRHYGDASSRHHLTRVVGDGTSIESVGECVVHGETYRVDMLTLDVPIGIRPRKLHFKDLGGPASFVVFDVIYEYEGVVDQRKETPSTVAFAQLGAAIRVGDRLKFSQALDQLDHAIDEAEDPDDARSQALTFLSIIVAAIRETSALHPPPRLLLETARELDSIKTRAHIKEAIRARIVAVTDNLFAPSESPSDRLVDRALAIVERHYAKDLTDSMVAAQLGLSTSHFRFLFRQATGHPFHKYVVALRLEKAKQMLIEEELPVSQVAAAVGFTGLSHFSRAFTQRFSASPSHIRRAAG
ncbi:MAG TPA: AraC family transcriptional regulator [Fimbriimonadaceae bacterium]|nr:AraC family transcriptional regulator [Fimbriimonadaceae bacterium]